MSTKGSRVFSYEPGIRPYGHLIRRDSMPVTGETYHVFNRGAHKSELFRDESDYDRFQLLAFLSNSHTSVNMRGLAAKYKGQTFARIFEREHIERSFVDILAYSFMPNHFHMVLQQRTERGIECFMKKLATAYSMHFNLKYQHSGTLFQGRFKSSRITNEPYFRWIFSYVHLNPVALCEPNWEEDGIHDPDGVRRFLRSYPYSSYFDYQVGDRPERKILSIETAPLFLFKQDDLEDMPAVFAKV